MPNALVAKYAKESGLSTSQVEGYWDSAKEYVKKHLGFKTDDKRFYPSVVGALKRYLRSHLKKEELEIAEKFITLLENTETGDVMKFDQPMNVIVQRKPDGTTYDGLPYFNLDDKHMISKLLDGKKKHERWQNILSDKGIHDWANKNFLKGFYVKTSDGLLIKIR